MSCVQNWNIVAFPERLSEKEEAELFEQKSHGSMHARRMLIIHNMRLVMMIARRYIGNYADRDDIISCGMIGLIKAVDSFNHRLGVRFSSFAVQCIKNEIMCSFFRQKAKSNKDIFYDDIEDDDGRLLTIEDTLIDPANVEESVDWRLSRDQVELLVDSELTQQQQRIIKRRYGLDGRAPATQVKVAEELCITYSGVGKAEKRAIKKLSDKFWGDE